MRQIQVPIYIFAGLSVARFPLDLSGVLFLDEILRAFFDGRRDHYRLVQMTWDGTAEGLPSSDVGPAIIYVSAGVSPAHRAQIVEDSFLRGFLPIHDGKVLYPGGESSAEDFSSELLQLLEQLEEKAVA